MKPALGVGCGEDSSVEVVKSHHCVRAGYLILWPPRETS